MELHRAVIVVVQVVVVPVRTKVVGGFRAWHRDVLVVD